MLAGNVGINAAFTSIILLAKSSRSTLKLLASCLVNNIVLPDIAAVDVLVLAGVAGTASSILSVKSSKSTENVLASSLVNHIVLPDMAAVDVLVLAGLAGKAAINVALTSMI